MYSVSHQAGYKLMLTAMVLLAFFRFTTPSKSCCGQNKKNSRAYKGILLAWEERSPRDVCVNQWRDDQAEPCTTAIQKGIGIESFSRGRCVSDY